MVGATLGPARTGNRFNTSERCPTTGAGTFILSLSVQRGTSWFCAKGSQLLFFN